MHGIVLRINAHNDKDSPFEHNNETNAMFNMSHAQVLNQQKNPGGMQQQ